MARTYVHTLSLSLGGDEPTWEGEAKTCRDCGAEFAPSAHQLRKRDYQCRTCRLAYRNEWYRDRAAGRFRGNHAHTDDDVRAVLLNRIEYDAFGGCWLWSGEHYPNGYGRVRFRRRQVQAHRVAYTLMRGEIPEGLTIDHLCRVRCCVNPSHMEPVTAAENSRRRWARFSTPSRSA